MPHRREHLDTLRRLLEEVKALRLRADTLSKELSTLLNDTAEPRLAREERRKKPRKAT
jgi:hypothetical protein